MKLFRFSLALFISLLIAGCGSTTEITSDYNVQTDFSSYKTFKFLPWYAGSTRYVTEEGKERLYSQVEEQLLARGLKNVSGEADLTVALIVFLDEKTDYNVYTRYYSTGGFGYYYPFGYGISSSNYYMAKDYLQGAIIVDLFDHAAKNTCMAGCCSSRAC
jgi:hypothetical protein